ncbi:peptide ligase PGM1-related protein [Streptomyces sclerotialus]|uniref:preATP grasp domain-containing protein n=1 Tax=Streptomyces sclerotialus TaxID=1957 RepID=UPI0004CA637B
MSTLFIANNRTAQMVGDLEELTPDHRRNAGVTAQRMIWYASEGDVLVVPHVPSEEFLAYVTGLTGADRSKITVIAPPAGWLGTDVLTPDRWEDEEFLRELGEHVRASGVDRVFPIYFDSSVIRLTRELGLDESTSGFPYIHQGGGQLLNSKATFRAVAAGGGCPIPRGIVAFRRAEAEDFLWELLSEDRHAIVKKDFHVAGYGNAILSRDPGVTPIGAPEVTVLNSRDDLAAHLDKQWGWYSEDGTRPVVVEDYAPDSSPVYAEFRITAHETTLFGHGEMLMGPIFNGLVIPAKATAHPEFPRFLDEAHRLCETVRTMGYRGPISVDGIVTPDDEILLNEFNGRVGGSTHINYLAEQLVGDDFLRERLLIQRHHWPVPSFEEAVRRLEREGLAYDRDERTGVVLTSDDSRLGGTVEYCLIAKDMSEAEKTEEVLAGLFG